MKSVLISIKPHYCKLIASGKKTLEIRKSKPNMGTPFKCYIYCTKSGEKLSYESYCGFDMDDFTKDFSANGNVIGEFVCDRIDSHAPDCLIVKEDRQSATAGSCLSGKEILEYLSGNKLGVNSYLLCQLPDFYGWHITELKIYDAPKSLAEFGLKRAPQSWCYVEGS